MTVARDRKSRFQQGASDLVIRALREVAVVDDDSQPAIVRLEGGSWLVDRDVSPDRVRTVRFEILDMDRNRVDKLLATRSHDEDPSTRP